MLPYLAMMPRDLLGSDPSVLAQLLSSIWLGWEVAGAQGASRAAAAECYVECFVWTLARSREVRTLTLCPVTSSSVMGKWSSCVLGPYQGTFDGLLLGPFKTLSLSSGR